MIKTCKNCQNSFEITDSDLKFYDKISPVFNSKKYQIPAPTFCPECRQQRRLILRNERNFYHRKCDLTGKQIISIYSKDKACKVYDYDVWWSDKWNALQYERNFDFNKSFFEQFNELSLETPRPCVVNMSSENSLYTNHSAYNKNCYMCINTGYCEDILYSSNYVLHSKNCTDCLGIRESEFCYECVNIKNCWNSKYLFECSDCSDCSFCFDCSSCNDCFCSWNLRRKKYCIFNKQYSKEEYKQKLLEISKKTYTEYKNIKEKFYEHIERNAIHRNLIIIQCENSSGEHLTNCKNVQNSYYTFNSQDCKYCYDCGEINSSYDAFEPYKGELQYETHGCNLGYNLKFCSKSYESNDLIYCQYCWYCKDCFGCFGLKHKQYCILNKQYSKEEYEKLVPKIIESIMKNKEWGEFFPSSISPFTYNETVANEYFPLTKKESLAQGYKWKDGDLSSQHQGPDYQISENINDVKNDITTAILKCEATGKLYKIIPQELKFYKQMNLPIPRKCPDQRHKERMALRNPRKLFDRNCTKCNSEIQTTYSPDRKEIVYCEKCYLKEVY